MTETFVIHHLSDLHVGPLHNKADRKLRFVPADDEGVRQGRRYLAYLRSH
jgi:hypothetical protein